MFIKIFVIQKLKSSTNLNHKEGKQVETTIDWSTTISDPWGKNISGVISPWDYFPEGSVFGTTCPRGNYVGDKSSERQFSSEEISSGILSGDNYLWGNCPGAIIRGQSSSGQLSGGNFPLGQLSSRAIVRGQSSRCQLSGGQFSLGVVIRGQFSSGAIVRISIETCAYDIAHDENALSSLIS